MICKEITEHPDFNDNKFYSRSTCDDIKDRHVVGTTRYQVSNMAAAAA